MSDPALAPMLCTTCAGAGLSGGSRCRACNGVGSALFFDDQALTVGLRIDSFAILERRFEATVRGVLDFILVIIGVAGFFLLGWELWEQGADAVIRASFWQAASFRLLGFWISTWFDAYLAYRLIRESERIVPLRARSYRTAEVPAPRPMTFEEFSRTPAAARTDITRSFSTATIRALESAYGLAERQSHAAAGGTHLFAALLSNPVIGYLFQRLGVESGKLKDALVKAIEAEPPRTGALLLSPEFFRVMYAAYLDACANHESSVGPVAFFSALVRESPAVQEILDRAGVDREGAANVIAWVRGEEALRTRIRSGRRAAARRSKGAAGSAMTGLATPYLEHYAEDLTEVARVGGFLPIFGRETELSSLFRITEGGHRSVLVVGERGVGKDALLQAVAERMVEEQVPAVLSDKRLLQLSVSRIVAGGNAAEVAGRFERIFFEIARARNVVLAVPGVASLIGITIGKEGGLDLGEVLANAANQGQVMVIATATPAEASAIERSPLGSSFERVLLAPPEVNAAIQMVLSHVGYIEFQQRVIFSYAAVARAVTLADRYLHDVELPEKGIEILKEVAAAVRGTRGERAVVTPEDVAVVVAEKSKIPVSAVTEDESAKLMRLEETMHRRIVGQDEAVAAVASAIRRSRAELRSEKRPIANLLFLGPTGVGKTEVAKTLAETYFGAEDRMIRLDMSEYQTQESLYRLVGAPGSTTGGLLTEAVRREPFSLVLLDELEKAHPDILNAFLQVMEDGRLTDATGRTADFTNAVLIATSNAGTQVIQEEIKKGTDIKSIKKRLMESELKGVFRPEFLNRFDSIVLFKPLSAEEIVEVARRMLAGIAVRLGGKGITLQVTEEALRELAAAGFDPLFGARPLRRVIQEKVEDALATFLLQNKLGRRDVVTLGPGNTITVTKKD